MLRLMERQAPAQAINHQGHEHQGQGRGLQRRLNPNLRLRDIPGQGARPKERGRGKSKGTRFSCGRPFDRDYLNNCSEIEQMAYWPFPHHSMLSNLSVALPDLTTSNLGVNSFFLSTFFRPKLDWWWGGIPNFFHTKIIVFFVGGPFEETNICFQNNSQIWTRISLTKFQI